MSGKSATVLSELGRSIRDEPKHYIFKHQIWFTANEVPVDTILKWLKMRYAENKRGYRFRLNTYRHQNGNRYADNVLLETLNDTDAVYIRLHWGWSETKIRRPQVKGRRPRLNKEQRAKLNQRIQDLIDDFYDSL